MIIETLAELCMRSVIENFDTNRAIIDIYDLGDKACADIIDRLSCAKKIDDSTVDRLEVHGIETLKLFTFFPGVWSDKMCRWLADVVASGLEELMIDCDDFDRTIAKAIVETYEKKMPASTSRNSIELVELQRPAVAPALRTLRICDCRSDSFVYLSRMLSIFASTLKNLCLVMNELKYEFVDVVGTLCLDKLVLRQLCFDNKHIFTVMPSMQHLQTLKLVSIDNLTDHHVLSFLEVAGHSLQHLYFGECCELTDATLQNIKLYCPNVVSLGFEGPLSKMTRAGLEHFFATGNLAKLQRLILYRVTQATDAVVAKIAAAARQLSYLCLCECSQITVQSLQALASIQTLKYLTLMSVYLGWGENDNTKSVKEFMTRHGLEECNVYDKLHPDQEW